MKNYLEESGLDFTIGENNKLNYKKEDFAPAVDWVKDFQFAKYAYKMQNLDNGPTYFGVRYMEQTKDEQIFQDHNMMGDITVFEPGFVGEEFVKTVGHYHGHTVTPNLSYPEVYQAISGKVEYLLQSEPDKDGGVNVLWVMTEPGDKVVMPPNVGHVSLNAGNDIAVECDLQKRDNPDDSEYSLFKEKVGGALYRTANGLTENKNYKINSLRIVRPLEKPEWGLTKDKPLYTAFVENPEKFKWLTNPQDFEFNLDELFEDIEL